MISAKGLFALGAATFWLPEILLYAWTRHNLNGRLVTLLLPGIFLLGYVLISILRRNQAPKPSAAIFMLLGVVFWHLCYYNRCHSAGSRLRGTSCFHVAGSPFRHRDPNLRFHRSDLRR